MSLSPLIFLSNTEVEEHINSIGNLSKEVSIRFSITISLGKFPNDCSVKI